MNKLQVDNKGLWCHIRELTVFALPISISMFINMLANFGAMFMVAKLGEKELAAGALAVSTYMTFSMVLLIFYAVGILISYSRGQERPPNEIGEIVRSALWLALSLTLPIGLLLWNADKLLILFKQESELVSLTRGYFHFAALSMLPTLLGMVIGQFYTGIGYPRIGMLISMFVTPAVLLLSYGFILGNFGFPQLGLAGVSCSLLIVQCFTTSCMVIFLFIGKNAKKYDIFSGRIWPTFSVYKNIFTLGCPIGLQFGGELAAMTVATYFMGHFGVTALAASQIVSQYSMLVVMIILGISQAVSMLVSTAYGKQNIVLIKQYIFSAFVVLSIAFLFVAGVFFLLPLQLIQFFGGQHNAQNGELVRLAVPFFMLAVITLYADGFRNIFSGALRGVHDSKAPMYIGTLCLWFISIPLCYLIGFLFHHGPLGLRVGFMSGFIIAAVLLGLRVKDKIVSKSMLV